MSQVEEPPVRYHRLRQIGAGGMGVVWEAEDRERGQRVALKTIVDPDVEQIYRLKREFRVLADLGHPNLVSLYDLVVDGDNCFFTMELLDGTDLLSHVWGRPAEDSVGLANTANHSMADPAPPGPLAANVHADAFARTEAPGSLTTPCDDRAVARRAATARARAQRASPRGEGPPRRQAVEHPGRHRTGAWCCSISDSAPRSSARGARLPESSGRCRTWLRSSAAATR